MLINRIRIDYTDHMDRVSYEVFELTEEQAGLVSEVGFDWNPTAHVAHCYIRYPTGERVNIGNEKHVFHIRGMSAYYRAE